MFQVLCIQKLRTRKPLEVLAAYWDLYELSNFVFYKSLEIQEFFLFLGFWIGTMKYSPHLRQEGSSLNEGFYLINGERQVPPQDFQSASVVMDEQPSEGDCRDSLPNPQSSKFII